MITLAPEPIDIAALTADFVAEAGEAGAIVTFSGIVRPDDGVEALFLDHAPGLAENEIAVHEAQARRRWPLLAVAIVHRIGRVSVGEPIVFVATAAAHRRAAFEACDFLMDYLKSAAPFWKKEISARGETWIEPRAQDFADRDRWERKP